MNIRIVEECWGINRRTGKRSSAKTDEKVFTPIVGTVMDMPIVRRTEDINTPSPMKSNVDVKGEAYAVSTGRYQSHH